MTTSPATAPVTDRWRADLTALLLDIAVGFAGGAPAETGVAVTAALARVGSYLGADRAYTCLIDPETGELSVGQDWYRDEGVARVDPVTGLTVHAPPSWLARILAGEAVYLPTLTDPLSVALAGDPAAAGPARSVALLPVHTDATPVGFVAFEVLQVTRPWPADLAELLLPIGAVLSRALAGEGSAAAREASEQRYKALLDEVGDVIVRVGPDGGLTYVNRAWVELTGISIEETLGKDCLHHVHPDDRLLAVEHVASAMMGNPDMREVRFMAGDGSVRWMEVRGRALFHPDGTPAGLAGTLHDVTARKEAETQAQTARAEAEQARDEAVRARDEALRASQAKSEFLSRMSHELRTPLNAILGFTQLLAMDTRSQEDGDSIALISRAGRHLLGLINDALDVSQIESGRLPLTTEPVGLADLVEESFDLVRPASTAREVVVSPASGIFGAQVLADPQRLKQVLVNLLSNAVKYNRQGGRVVVDCEPASGRGPGDAGHGWLRISVRDTGQGIASERLEDVFTPFERLGAERTDVEGSGIGLSLARSLVTAMGGEIGVTSEVGVGSTFHVDLPAAAPHRPGDRESRPEEQPGVRTVLYIEDNASNVTLMRRVLALRPQIRLHLAGDGMSGLAAARAQRPDLLLLDLHLPLLDGVRVLSAIRRDDDPSVRELPVVVVTADLSEGTAERLREAGADAFIGKPFEIDELLSVVDTHLKM